MKYITRQPILAAQFPGYSDLTDSSALFPQDLKDLIRGLDHVRSGDNLVVFSNIRNF